MVNLIFSCPGRKPDANERTWHVDVSTGKSIIGAQKVETKPDNGSWRRQQLFAIDRLNWKVMLATIQRLTSASRQGSISAADNAAQPIWDSNTNRNNYTFADWVKWRRKAKKREEKRRNDSIKSILCNHLRIWLTTTSRYRLLTGIEQPLVVSFVLIFCIRFGFMRPVNANIRQKPTIPLLETAGAFSPKLFWCERRTNFGVNSIEHFSFT